MPLNKYAIARYYIIDNLLRKNKYVKTNYIVEYCMQETGYSVSQRTIQMDINAMKNDPFLGYYAPISYCKQNKAFYYADKNYRISSFHFTKKEIGILESLLLESKKNGKEECFHILNGIVQRMKAFIIE